MTIATVGINKTAKTSAAPWLLILASGFFVGRKEMGLAAEVMRGVYRGNGKELGKG